MYILGKALERGALTEGSGGSERMELAEVPDAHRLERKKILATVGFAGGFQLIGKRRISIDGTHWFEHTHILEEQNPVGGSVTFEMKQLAEIPDTSETVDTNHHGSR